MIDKLIKKFYKNEEAVVANKALFWSCFNRDLNVFNIHVKPSRRDAIYGAINALPQPKSELLEATMMTTYTTLQHIIELFKESRVDPRVTETYALLVEDINVKKDIYFKFYSSTSVSTYLYLHPALSNSNAVIITKDWHVNEDALDSYINELIDDYGWLATKNRTLPSATDAALETKLSSVLEPVFSMGGCMELHAQIINPFGGDNGERFIYHWLSMYFQDMITKTEMKDFILERIYDEQRYFKNTTKQIEIVEPDYRVKSPVVNPDRLKSYTPEDPRQYFYLMARTKRKPNTLLEHMLETLGLQQYYAKPLGLSHPDLLGNLNIIGCTGSGSNVITSVLMDNTLRSNNGAIITLNTSTPKDLSIYTFFSKVAAAQRIGDVVMCDIEQAMDLDFEELVNENKIVVITNDCTPYSKATHEDIDRYVKFLEMLSKIECYFDNTQHYNFDICGLTNTERFLYTAAKPIKELNAKGLGVINAMGYYNEYPCEVSSIGDIAKMISLFRTQVLMKVETPPEWLCQVQGGYVAYRCKQLNPGDGMLFVNSELVHQGRLVYHESEPDELNLFLSYAMI